MISIVVPAYNAAGVIERCINSVLQQTYSDFELLIVDDGSTDNTAELVAVRAALDARIRLIQQANAGVSSARNTGIDAASGDLLCFIDSDDTVSANYLEILYTLYSPGALPVIDVMRSDGVGSALSNMPEIYTLDATWTDSYFCGQLRYGIAFSVWNKLYSLQIIRREHISFLPELSIGEDMLFVSSICSIVNSFISAMRPVTITTLYRDRLCHRQEITRCRMRKHFWPWLTEVVFPRRSNPPHCTDGRLTRSLRLSPIRLLSAKVTQSSVNGGADSAVLHYTTLQLCRKNLKAINVKFCTLRCAPEG